MKKIEKNQFKKSLLTALLVVSSVAVIAAATQDGRLTDLIVTNNKQIVLPDDAISQITSSPNLVAPNVFNPVLGKNVKASSQAAANPAVDAFAGDGAKYWFYPGGQIYNNTEPRPATPGYKPSSFYIAIDLGVEKIVDATYLVLVNNATISSRFTTAISRYEVLYSNDARLFNSLPEPNNDRPTNYDWKKEGWNLAGGTETEGMFSEIKYGSNQWGYDTKEFVYPFTARYVMIHLTLLGSHAYSGNSAASWLNRMNNTPAGFSDVGLADVRIFGRDVNPNETALNPRKGVYSKWDENCREVATVISLGGKSLVSIDYKGKALNRGSDYTFSGGRVAFTDAFVGKLPLGTAEFEFNFNSGASSTYQLVVTAENKVGNAVKISPVAGMSAFKTWGAAFGTDEPIEGPTKRVRYAYNATGSAALESHLENIFDEILGKDVFAVRAHNGACMDGCAGHKNIFEPELNQIRCVNSQPAGAGLSPVQGNSDRQRIELRPSEDSSGKWVCHDGDLVKYEWDWFLPNSIGRVGGFCHLFQLKAVNRWGYQTLPEGNNRDENGAYVMAFSRSGNAGGTDGNLNLVHTNTPNGGETQLLSIPFSQVVNRWIHVEMTILNSDCGWVEAKVTDKLTGAMIAEYNNRDVFTEHVPNNDAVRDLWRSAEIDHGGQSRFELPYPAAFDQYNRPKWGIYRSVGRNGIGNGDVGNDAEARISDVTITKIEENIIPLNIALNKKAYNIGPVDATNPVQQAAASNPIKNGSKLTNLVLHDPATYDVSNVNSPDAIGLYSWLGTNGANKGSFVIDLGEKMDFSQIRLFSKSDRLKGVTVFVSDDVSDRSAAAEFDAMTFTPVAKKASDAGFTYLAPSPGTNDNANKSYPIDLGKTYSSRYVRIDVENASGANTGGVLTGPPRLTNVQIFNAPAPPQNVKLEKNTVTWENSNSNEIYMYNGTTLVATLPGGTTSHTFASLSASDLSRISIRASGVDKYSRKSLISVPAVLNEAAENYTK